ncbi:MAG: hypothetical protein Q8N83_02305 [Ignavibacteria bacterium]|nr:hypothetical protein [Ignavibacteria bacterium]
MKIFLFFFIIISMFFETGQTTAVVEILGKNGKVISFEQIGQSSTKNGKLVQALPVQQKGTYFYLHLNKISTITFRTIKEKSIVAKVVFLSGVQKEFDFVKTKLYCKRGDEIIRMPLEAIRTIKFIKS